MDFLFEIIFTNFYLKLCFFSILKNQLTFSHFVRVFSSAFMFSFHFYFLLDKCDLTLALLKYEKYLFDFSVVTFFKAQNYINRSHWFVIFFLFVLVVNQVSLVERK